ncbi:hypothetical protein [Brevibacillus borstelensis]|uniref:hypothetical protein n=1 Tax=Brevibacillus borstelensis TaxID=45462 RepID=UPI0004F3E75B|nr:hypothetical protein [Brevibacillus borstelensis]KKX55945.1 hypothetical protein X546_09940 [Brevibacillus borstelensis cifa_chp40]
MDDLLELLFDLLGWAIPLIGKFWFVILGYLGYKLLGLKGNKKPNQKPAPRPVLTPADGGGWPWEQEQEERRTVTSLEPRPEAAPAMESNVQTEGWQESEHLVTLETAVEAERPLERKESASAPAVSREEEQHDTFDPREGMKWAMIYGPPRARTPHLPARRSL